MKSELVVEYHFNSNGLQNSYGSKYGKENGGKNATLETAQVVTKDLIVGSLPSLGPVSADNALLIVSIFEKYQEVKNGNETAKSVVTSSLADDLHLEGAIVSQGGASQVQYTPSVETYKEIEEFNKKNNTNYTLKDVLDPTSNARTDYDKYLRNNRRTV